MEIDRKRIQEMSFEQLRQLAFKGEVVLASKEGFKKLTEIVDMVRKEIKEQEMALGEAARDNPDLPENTQFKEIKTRLQFELPKKLNDFKEQENKTILYTQNIPTIISFGSVFEADIRYPDAKEIESEKFILLGPIETMYMKSEYFDCCVISYMSPFGRTLWGKPYKDGAKYQIETLAGIVECEIKIKNDEQ